MEMNSYINNNIRRAEWTSLISSQFSTNFHEILHILFHAVT